MPHKELDKINKVVTNRLDQNVLIFFERYKLYVSVLSFAINILFLIGIYFIILSQNSVISANAVMSNYNQQLIKFYELCKVNNITEACDIVNSVNFPMVGFNITASQFQAVAGSFPPYPLFIIFLALVTITSAILIYAFNNSLRKQLTNIYDFEEKILNYLAKKIKPTSEKSN